MKQITTWQEALLNDPTVSNGMAGGHTKEEIIIQLVNQKNFLLQQMYSLSSIPPRKIKMPGCS